MADEVIQKTSLALKRIDGYRPTCPVIRNIRLELLSITAIGSLFLR
jgi:hypothetical protein